MATANKFDCFVENLSEKVHNLQSDTLQIALTNTAPAYTNTLIANITEIAYTNLSARACTVSTSAASGTAGSSIYKLVVNDLVLTASGAVATFRYVVLYNITAASGPLILWYDYGSAVTLANGETFTIDFDGTNGVLTLQ